MSRDGCPQGLRAGRDDVLAGERVGTAALTPTIAVTAGILADFRGDPADRLIYATAAVSNLPLVTKDRQLVETAARSGSVATIW
ncbi:hypothetical protein BH23ACT9_BH23ACT9_28770 [soil metagenome]